MFYTLACSSKRRGNLPRRFCVWGGRGVALGWRLG